MLPRNLQKVTAAVIATAALLVATSSVLGDGVPTAQHLNAVEAEVGPLFDPTG
jgi:hypothetical protein